MRKIIRVAAEIIAAAAVIGAVIIGILLAEGTRYGTFQIGGRD